jgi:hypothetical protein
VYLRGVSVRRLSTRSRADRGAVAVEFALVLPLLGMLVLGIITSGLSYSHAIGLSNAVREGARFGAVRVSDAGWPDAVIARTRETQFDDPSASTVVCVKMLKNNAAEGTAPATPTQVVHPPKCTPTGPTVALAPAAPAVEGQRCVVMVWAEREYQIQALLVSWDKMMVRQSVARYERAC